MNDGTRARTHMVDSQVRPNGVTSVPLLEAMLNVPREDFVPEAVKGLAYMEGRLGLAPGRFMTEPMVLAKLIQALDVAPSDKVLVIGAGLGYAVALLSRLVGHVVGLESDGTLTAGLCHNVGEWPKVSLVQGALNEGVAAQGPYDRILIDGAIEVWPQALSDQLADHGQAVGVWVDKGAARACVWTKIHGVIGHRPVFDARLAVLPGFAKPKSFVF